MRPCCRSPASGSWRSGAARRCTWPRPTPRPGRRRGRARPTPSPPPRCRPGRRYDRLVAISRSGTTSEVVRLLDAAPPGLPTLVITAVAGSPCAERATAAVVLDFADEESVVQTRFATTALVLLLAGIGIDIDAEADAAALAILMPVPDVTGARAVRVPRLGLDRRPGQRGGAQAARGGRRVGRGLPGDGVPATARSAPTPTRRWCGRSARSIPACSTMPSAPDLRSPSTAPSPLASLVLAQRVAVALARARNLDPDHPHSLTRSVVLP